MLGAPRPGAYRFAVHADGYDGAEATVEVQGDGRRPSASGSGGLAGLTPGQRTGAMSRSS